MGPGWTCCRSAPRSPRGAVGWGGGRCARTCRTRDWGSSSGPTATASHGAVISGVQTDRQAARRCGCPERLGRARTGPAVRRWAAEAARHSAGNSPAAAQPHRGAQTGRCPAAQTQSRPCPAGCRHKAAPHALRRPPPNSPPTSGVQPATDWGIAPSAPNAPPSALPLRRARPEAASSATPPPSLRGPLSPPATSDQVTPPKGALKSAHVVRPACGPKTAKGRTQPKTGDRTRQPLFRPPPPPWCNYHPPLLFVVCL